MSSRRQRQGVVTRVGVAVMIAIGLFLASMMSLGVSSAREAGRRNKCGCHMGGLGGGLVAYAEHNRHFPGYVNKVGGKSVSWLAPMLPYLDRNDLYSQWSDPAISADQAPVPTWSFAICPSDPLAASCPPGALSYLINAGEATIESPANGLALDQSGDDPQRNWVSLDYIVEHDGASNTIVLVESTLAGPWNIMSARAAKLQCAAVWHKTPNPTAAMKPNGPRGAATRPNVDLTYARPTSPHPDSFNVRFADGHLKSIANDIDYIVYRQLMTPNGMESDDPVKRLLKDTDY